MNQECRCDLCGVPVHTHRKCAGCELLLHGAERMVLMTEAIAHFVGSIVTVDDQYCAMCRQRPVQGKR